MVDDTGFGFYYQPAFNPGIQELYDRRDRMGVRTFVNTIETVANPANADVHLGSFYHLAFAKKMIDLIEESEELAFSRAIFFQGMEGYDDIRPGYTKVAEWDRAAGASEDANGDLEDYEIETADYGMEMDGDDLAVDDVTADSATITEEVLAGEREDQFADAIALNGRSGCTPARTSILSRTDSSGPARPSQTAAPRQSSRRFARSDFRRHFSAVTGLNCKSAER